jgi:hypothetical protein
MFRTAIAALLLTVPAGTVGQAIETGIWAVNAMPNGCMLQAVTPQGTMLSVWGTAGDDKLGFLLQNKGWKALRDGASYHLKLDFLGVSSLPVDATARREIDDDGPGFYFQLQPGGSSGKAFMDAFSSAQGMRISQNGQSVDTLSLAGSQGAMSSLARCLAEHWSDADPQAAGEEPEAQAVAVSI